MVAEAPALPMVTSEPPPAVHPEEEVPVSEPIPFLSELPPAEPAQEPPSPAPMVAAVEPALAIEPIILTDVYFDFDRYEIRADAMTVLEANAS